MISRGAVTVTTDSNMSSNSLTGQSENGATDRQSVPNPETAPTRSNTGQPNSLIVSPKQRGNPILKFVRSVPWEFGDIVPDYQLGVSSCALYLSLRYHNLNPNYIHERLKQLANSYHLRVILVQVDVKDPYHALKELAKMCILADCTLMLAFTHEEAGRYLETYKAFENKPADLIMEKTETNYLARVTESLTSVNRVNKTDSTTLLSTFLSFDKIVNASEDDLSLCPGLGPQKASRLHKTFHQPFVKDVKKPDQRNTSKSASSVNTEVSK